jgi:hypothetical protein
VFLAAGWNDEHYRRHGNAYFHKKIILDSLAAVDNEVRATSPPLEAEYDSVSWSDISARVEAIVMRRPLRAAMGLPPRAQTEKRR